MREEIEKVKIASSYLNSLTEKDRRDCLYKLSELLVQKTDAIITANNKDLAEAKALNLSPALLDRLELNTKRIKALAQAVTEIANYKQVVGVIKEEKIRNDGLIIQRQTIPLGVILMIFESRPNVLIDAAALSIKSGNAIILKGGKEARQTLQQLFEVLTQATSSFLPSNTIKLLSDRSEVEKILAFDDLIDLVIPRGGPSLVQNVKANAKMPVMSHDRGLCHVYLHADARPELAKSIVLNAKLSRPGVCNAMETLLVHQDFPKQTLVDIVQTLIDAGVKIHGPQLSSLPSIIPIQDQDYHTEWLSQEMSLRLVNSAEEAIDHIIKYGSHHTEAVITEDQKIKDLFIQKIDSSCLMINASTRFNDGGELGLGAELGISTSKFHAYGPVGAEAMTATRTVVIGNGHIRE